MGGWTTPLTGLTIGVVGTARGPVETARVGKGSAVLCIHGITESWRQAVPLAEDLVDGFDAILPSRPGYGATPLSTGRTYDDQADAYAALLDALGVRRCAVIAISGGGPSAVAFASRYRERTTSLVLACALVSHLIEMPRGLRMYRVRGLAEALAPLSRRVARRNLGHPEKVDAALADNLTSDEYTRMQADPRIKHDLVRHAWGHTEAPAGIRGVRNDIAQVENAYVHPQTFDVACPVLVTHGEADAVVPVAHARFHAKAFPGAKVVTYTDAGHVFLFTRRREASGEIRRFLTESS